MISIKHCITAATALTLMFSCTTQSLETTFTSQDTRIDSYIEKIVLDLVDVEGNPILDENGNKITLKPEVVTRNGCHRVIINDGKGDGLSTEGSATIYYAGYVFTTGPSTMFATNHRETALNAKWSEDMDFEPLRVSPGDKNLVTGLRNALPGAKAGEECWIYFSGKYGFGKKAVGIIPANSAICYHIWVESIEN
ncbi:MAG: FKBP-type peptidyl-prolyl cis-trans isomerase [Bacteroidales bacterium]|nr:FKBP-type peptidyl-prolyl cis-trans isomerase [Bacteroidales bacterium]